MKRWCLASSIGVKKLHVYFLCHLVYLFCCLADLSCRLVHLVCHLADLSCHLVYLLCHLVALRNGTYRSALPAKTQVSWLFAHSQRMPMHVGPLIQDWSVSVLFSWCKGNFFLTSANQWIEAFTPLSVLLGNAIAQLDNYFVFITYFND